MGSSLILMGSSGKLLLRMRKLPNTEANFVVSYTSCVFESPEVRVFETSTRVHSLVCSALLGAKFAHQQQWHYNASSGLISLRAKPDLCISVLPCPGT